jgi:hypothetical protein
MSRYSKRAEAAAHIQALTALGYIVNIIRPDSWYCQGETGEHWQEHEPTLTYDENGFVNPSGECGYCGGQFEYRGFMPEPGMTVDQAAKALGLKVYDTALPQDWVNDMWERVGYKTFGKFVWCYDDAKSWGEPVALCPEAAAALEDYESITERGGK